MLEYINKRLSNDYEYFVFAMRRNGSDGKAFLYERAKQYDTAYLSEFYRQIFICKVEHSDDDIHVTMKEIGGIQHINIKEM